MTAPARTPPVIAVMGPTAAGKTALAVAARAALPVEIISVDSAMVYRGLDIGTAKPDPATLATTPHALVDIREPWEGYSAEAFRRDALAAIDRAREAGRMALLVGGTMLYFRALLGGLSKLPAADPALREAIGREAERRGWAALHRELAARDPEAARRIHPNDPQRIQRALEVLHLTGRPISALQARREGLRLPVRRLVLAPADRSALHARIAARRDEMFAAGFVEEVRGLAGRHWFRPDLPSMRAVGYRQVLGHLEGRYGAEECRARVLYATRQLAKRQLTWLRKERGAAWIDPTAEGWIERALAQISHTEYGSIC